MKTYTFMWTVECDSVRATTMTAIEKLKEQISDDVDSFVENAQMYEHIKDCDRHYDVDEDEENEDGI